jgi:hypothetical protein
MGLESDLLSGQAVKFGVEVNDQLVIKTLCGLLLLVVVNLTGDSVLTELDEQFNETLDGALVAVLGNLNHAHDHWSNSWGLSCLVAGLEESLGLAVDLNKSGWGWVVLQGLHEVDTLINSANEVGVVDSAASIDLLLVLTSSVCVLKLGVDAGLLGQVVIEKLLATVKSISTTGSLVISSLHSKGSILNLSITESELIITVNTLLGCKAIVLSLLGHDFS